VKLACNLLFLYGTSAFTRTSDSTVKLQFVLMVCSSYDLKLNIMSARHLTQFWTCEDMWFIVLLLQKICRELEENLMSWNKAQALSSRPGP